MSKGTDNKNNNSDTLEILTVEDIDIEISKLRLIGGLLLGLDHNAVKIETDEIYALGHILTDLSVVFQCYNEQLKNEI